MGSPAYRRDQTCKYVLLVVFVLGSLNFGVYSNLPQG